ncbi:MAG: glycosyltransferase family 4 protein [Solirubrobacteraceae bacterium]
MAARPRLLILTPDYPPGPGGIQLLSERLACGLQGFDTRVLALSVPGAAQFDAASPVPVHRVGAPALAHSGRVALLNAVAAGQALRFRPNVTLSMHVVTSPAAAAICRVSGARTAQYFHAEEIGARPRLARFAAETADLAIAVSGYTAGLVRATGAEPRDIAVIPNGVDLPPDTAAEPCERPTFLTIARIQERYKGHDVLVRALALVRAKVPEVQWVVIGDGSLRAGVEQLARSYGVWDSCRFLGTVSDRTRDQWLRRTCLLAMPSRLPAAGQAGEGFGIVFLEAAAHGKPVVAGNVGGALDAVLDGETGLLVDPTEPVAVAEAITRLLSDPDLALRLGTAGRARAELHSWPATCGRVEAVLLGLLSSSADASSRAGASAQPGR